MVTQITQLPPAPSRQRPSEFSNEADAFVGQLPTFGNQANQLALEVNALATQVQSNTDTVVQASSSATSAKNEAVAAKDTAVASANTALNAAATATSAATTATAGANTATTQANRAQDIVDSISNITTGPVLAFNNRTGAVTLNSADVTGALGFNPAAAATTLAGYGITDGQQKYKQLHINTVTDAANVNIPLELNAEYSLYTGDSHSRPLPANPEIGDKVILYNLANSWGTGLFTLTRGNSAHNINQVAEDILFDTNVFKRIELTYVWGNSWIMAVS